MIHIIIDHREAKLKALLQEKFKKISFESQQLDVADIVVSENTAIERKEGVDFIGSLIDGRLFEQLERLKDTYENAILLLEGLNEGILENTGVKKTSIYGALAKISYKMGIAIIPTQNLEDTLIAIERIAFREQVKKGSSILSRKAPKEMTKTERRTFIIEGLVDIGPKKAQILIKRFKSPYQVFKAIKKTKILYTRTGNPKGLEGPLAEIKGFGHKFVKKNQEILFSSTEDKYKLKKDLQKRIDDILKD